jgi:hypothetical protein
MKAENLVRAIKAGSLAFNNHNLHQVQDAWAQSIIWEDAFQALGFDWLPDPEGISEHPRIFESWMVEAFRPKFSDEETRKRLALAREQILKEVERDRNGD